MQTTLAVPSLGGFVMYGYGDSIYGSSMWIAGFRATLPIVSNFVFLDFNLVNNKMNSISCILWKVLNYLKQYFFFVLFSFSWFLNVLISN